MPSCAKPFLKIADFLKDICDNLVIEFVPKTDPQAQRLLTAREDIFKGYTQEDFEDAMSRHFTILEKCPIQGSERTLYLMAANLAD